MANYINFGEQEESEVKYAANISLGLKVKVNIETVPSILCNQAHNADEIQEMQHSSICDEIASYTTLPEVNLFKKYHSNNILGNEPHKRQLHFEKFEILTSVFKSKVVLLDSKPYLTKSLNYCSECTILFADKNSIDNHTMAYHANEIIKRVPSLDVKKVATTHISRKPETLIGKMLMYQCYICSMYYKSLSQYESHMRLRHGLNETRAIAKRVSYEPWCRFCSKYFSSLNYFHVHLRACHNNIVNKKIGCSITKTNPLHRKSAEDCAKFFNCNVCGLYFKSSGRFRIHMLHNHRITLLQALKKESLNPVCMICELDYGTYSSYQTHVRYMHSDLVYKIIKNQRKERKESPEILENDIVIQTETVEQLPNRSEEMNNSLRHTKLYQCKKCHVCGVQFQTHLGYHRHVKTFHYKKQTLKKQKYKKQLKLSCRIDLNDEKKDNIRNNTKKYHSRDEISSEIYNLQTNNYQLCNANNNKDREHDEILQSGVILPAANNTYNLYDEVLRNDLNLETDQDRTCSVLHSKIFRCDICWRYYNTSTALKNHLQYSYGLTVPFTTFKPVIFDPKCKFCSEEKETPRAYNAHVVLNHSNLIRGIVNHNANNENQVM